MIPTVKSEKAALRNLSGLWWGARLNFWIFSLFIMFALLFFVFLSSMAHCHHDSLRLVHLVFRHGQRTPASTYPNDPYKNETFSPYGWGQLTNEGKLQQYEQGKWLRERYKNFLGNFTPEAISAMTTDVDRTKMSSQYMFAGLFPPSGDQIWNKNLSWQAVPSSHQPLSQDKLLLVRDCPRYFEALEEAMEDDQVKNKLKSHSELYKYLTLHSGMTVKDPWDVEDIYSTLKAEEDFNLKLPEWTKSVYPEPMKEVTAYSYLLSACNNELKRIKGGPLLKKILDDSKSKIEGKTPKKKLYSYAGHDSTVSNLLLAMNLWTEQIPVYNILVIIEVHEENNVPTLKIFLRDSTEDPRELIVPGCQSPCPLKKAYEIFEPVLPNDLNKLCLLKNPDYVPKKDRGP